MFVLDLFKQYHRVLVKLNSPVLYPGWSERLHMMYLYDAVSDESHHQNSLFPVNKHWTSSSSPASSFWCHCHCVIVYWKGMLAKGASFIIPQWDFTSGSHNVDTFTLSWVKLEEENGSMSPVKGSTVLFQRDVLELLCCWTVVTGTFDRKEHLKIETSTRWDHRTTKTPTEFSSWNFKGGIFQGIYHSISGKSILATADLCKHFWLQWIRGRGT